MLINKEDHAGQHLSAQILAILTPKEMEATDESGKNI